MAWLWTAVWGLVRRLPEPAAFALGDLAARLAHRLRPSSRRWIRTNLSRVVPPEELDGAVAAAFRSYGRYYVEAFRAVDIDPERIQRDTAVTGMHHLDGVLDHGRGAIVLLAHHGSWDTAARWAETGGYHLAVVAEVLRPHGLFARFVRLREAIGLEVVPLRRGDDVVRPLRAALAANHIAGLLTDRDLSGRAPITDLFGEPARMPTGAVHLSRSTGAPIVPVTMLQAPGRTWHMHCLAPLDVSAGTIADGCTVVAGAIEELIRLDPVQWHAFLPVWVDDVRTARRERRGR